MKSGTVYEPLQWNERDTDRACCPNELLVQESACMKMLTCMGCGAAICLPRITIQDAFFLSPVWWWLHAGWHGGQFNSIQQHLWAQGVTSATKNREGRRRQELWCTEYSLWDFSRKHGSYLTLKEVQQEFKSLQDISFTAQPSPVSPAAQCPLPAGWMALTEKKVQTAFPVHTCKSPPEVPLSQSSDLHPCGSFCWMEVSLSSGAV